MKKVEDAKVEKITAEELEKLQGFVQGMNQVQLNIGGLEAQKMELLNQVAKIKEMLNEFQADLEKSYGKVSVSLVDGTISEDADNKED
jgi:allophanate hydrolase subunit 1